MRLRLTQASFIRITHHSSASLIHSITYHQLELIDKNLYLIGGYFKHLGQEGFPDFPVPGFVTNQKMLRRPYSFCFFLLLIKSLILIQVLRSKVLNPKREAFKNTLKVVKLVLPLQIQCNGRDKKYRDICIEFFTPFPFLEAPTEMTFLLLT